MPSGPATIAVVSGPFCFCSIASSGLSKELPQRVSIDAPPTPDLLCRQVAGVEQVVNLPAGAPDFFRYVLRAPNQIERLFFVVSIHLSVP